MVSTPSFRFLALLPFILQAVRAENDWKTPCFDGVCQYSITGSSSGTVKIWGSPDAITDITSAANWEILDCSPDKMDQDIRLVCKGDEDSDSGCAHLYQNIGAEGKIVRLPESCGQSAFARVKRAWVSEDQTIPSNVAKRLVRRGAKQPVVKALALDTDFSAVDWKKVGPVNIAIQGANFAGVDVKGTMVTNGSNRQRRGRLTSRDTNEFISGAIEGIKNKVEEVKDKVEDKAGEIKDKVEEKAGEVKDKVEETADKAKEKAGEVLDKVKDVNVNKTIDLPPINLAKTFNLVNQRLSCPPLDAGLNIDVSTTGTAQLSVGVAAIGTLVPPKFDDFQLLTGLTADIDGTLDMTADVSGVLDSGKIKIFEIGVPGLTIPGIIAVGPTLSINAQARADLNINMDMTVGFNYKVNNAELFFPPKDKNKSGGDFNIGDTPLTLSAAQNVVGTGTIEAHLIPSINFGISALNKVVQAQIFVDLDATAQLNLDVSASKEKSKGNEAAQKEAGAIDEGGEVLEEDGEVLEDDGTAVEDDGTLEEDGEVVDDGTVEEDGEVLEDETVEDDGTVEDETVEDDGTVAEDETVEEEATSTSAAASKASKAASAKFQKRQAEEKETEASSTVASVSAKKTASASGSESISASGNATATASVTASKKGKASATASASITSSAEESEATVTEEATVEGKESAKVPVSTAASAPASKVTKAASSTVSESSKSASATASAAKGAKASSTSSAVEAEATSVESTDETVETEDGEVVEDDGTVVDEDGEVLEDDGEVTEDDGEVAEDDGEVVEDDGTVAEDGEVLEDDGTVAEDGEVLEDDGTVTEDGEVLEDDGTVTEDGEVDGEVLEDDGTVTEDGEVLEDDGTVAEDGEVLEDGTAAEDGTITDTKTFGGCVDMKASLNVNAGARGSFFNLFNDQTVVPLFNKNFQLFKKCFGDQAATGETATDGTVDETATDETVDETVDETAAEVKKRSPYTVILKSRQAKQKNKSTVSSALQCLKNSVKPTRLTQGTISAKQIKATK